jgi:hypothetical protein
MTGAAGSCCSNSSPRGRARRVARGWDINPPGEPLLGDGNKIFDCRRGLGQIVAAAAAL